MGMIGFWWSGETFFKVAGETIYSHLWLLSLITKGCFWFHHLKRCILQGSRCSSSFQADDADGYLDFQVKQWERRVSSRRVTVTALVTSEPNNGGSWRFGPWKFRCVGVRSFIEGSLKVLLMAPGEYICSMIYRVWDTSQVVSRISEPSPVASDLSEVLWQFRLHR